jgi:uncharacterized protein
VNLYLDTSALVKLYLDEDGSGAVRQAVPRATFAATSTVAHAEAHAALARRRREGTISSDAMQRHVAELNKDLTRFVTLDVTSPLARRAGELAEEHELRGFDAVHLATALEFAGALDEPIVFACFDHQLTAAAASEGLVRFD